MLKINVPKTVSTQKLNDKSDYSLQLYSKVSSVVFVLRNGNVSLEIDAPEMMHDLMLLAWKYL